VDHRYLSPDEMIPGVRIEGAPVLVDLMAEYQAYTF
jgi:hypothetical protein